MNNSVIFTEISWTSFYCMGEKLLSVVVGVVSFSAEKPLDFHDTIFQYRLVFLKCHKAFEILSKVVLHH